MSNFGYLVGKADIAVTATPQRAVVGDLGVAHTVTNVGSKAIYYRYDPTVLPSTLAAATDALMRAAAGSSLAAGAALVVPAGTPWLDLACLTDETSTLRIDAGFQQV